MIDIKTGVEQNSLNLIHPIIYDRQNLIYAKQALQTHQSNNPQQRPTKMLTKEELEKTKEHKWLKNCETILINPDDYLDELEMIDTLIQDLSKEAPLMDTELNFKEPKQVIALDLETTGLNKTIKRIAGKNQSYNYIVGVCIAASDTKGYYIPVRHNGTDKVRNFDEETIIKLLQALVDTFHIVYHNAMFDIEVMAQSGVRMKHSSHSDTMILAILQGLRIQYRQVGLKFLSKELLNREMLEINEITGQKEYIQMQNTPASNAYVYGCSDAMNTFALFNYFLGSADNPYHTQKNTAKLLHSVIEPTRSMFRFGLPVRYEVALATLRTTIRRLIMLEGLFYDTCSNEDISISSAEQVGTHLYQLLKKEFENKYSPGHTITVKEKGFKILCDRLSKDFDMTVKVKELKTGTKIVADSSESVLYSLYHYLESSWDFVSDETYNEINILTEILMETRTLLQRLNIMFKLVRYCYNDDLNVCRAGISLRLCGADTLRYSNQSSRNGAFDNLSIVELRTKTNTLYNIGDGICGINAQGIPSDTGNKVKLKRVINFSELDSSMTEKWQKLNRRTEARLQEMFKLGKYTQTE